ncbi:MAG: bifunctional folylpolyglutamate synthase/dihydrofolate synthase, partial [Chloroflexi bacterium]|nr:bifunctional folylpolyglutamate synthase/dihydrofolate synthase [Chloroflexota bacterium]
GRKTAHIAGSKGKGSTSAMIASALSAGGLSTGFYTSPHLHTIRERMKIDDRLITEAEFAAFVSEMQPAIEAQNRGEFGELSTFEILTALAFHYFKKHGAQAQVLETGLGGRLDATNVVPHPDVCVLTSISLDHTAVLGDTIAKIAGEKAGIIKPGSTVVSAPQTADAAEVFRTVASQKGARLITVGSEITWRAKGSNTGEQWLEVKGLRDLYDLTIPLLGEHQLENAATAVGALEVLGASRDAIIAGLAKVNWPGRIEILRRDPILIADGAHNGDSARRLVEALKRYFKFDRSVLVIGTSADKNSGAMIAEFAPFFDEVIVTVSEHPRASKSAALAAEFARHGKKARETKSISEAISQAVAQAGKNDLICATGSLFVVAEVIEHVKGIPGERYPNMEPKR